MVVIGGGPAGAVAARVLASWNHRVLLLTRPIDRARGLAESLPPSTHKLLAEVGVLADVERAGFYRSTGNTAWWASSEPRVERFDGLGYQVFRPDFDRVLLDSARAAGVDVRDATDVVLRSSDFPVVLDSTGRSGVFSRRFRMSEATLRTIALVGVWRRRDAWPIPDPTHTVVETFDDGWAWSVPISADVRHAGVMLDPGRCLATLRHQDAIGMTRAVAALLDRAELQHTFACDASPYRSTRYADGNVLFVGDAGSFIDPLSSFGVKKALASAWIAAVTANTILTHPDRRDAALEFFNDWEQRVYVEHARRSREFARSAYAAHPHPFWASRAAIDVDDRDDAHDVRDAFERIRSADTIAFAMSDDVRIEPRPVIRGREIVLEEAFVGRVLLDPAGPRGPALRFAADVDLVALARIACRQTRVPDVFEEYCRTGVPAPLPNVMSGLSLLVAKGILHART